MADWPPKTHGDVVAEIDAKLDAVAASQTYAPSTVVTGAGVDLTGADDSTAAFAAKIAAAGVNGQINLPPGAVVKVAPGQLALLPGQTLVMHGAKIVASAAGTVLALDSGCQVLGGEIQGAGSSVAFNDADRLVSIIGTVSAYKSNVRLRDVYLHGSGGYAIFAQFVDRLDADVRIYNIAYAGVLAASVSRSKVHVDADMNNPVGSASNAYGVTFTRYQGTLAAHPRSVDCEASGTVRNLPIWEAFDTHGGERIRFADVTAINCGMGVCLVSSNDGAGVNTFAPMSCSVDRYTIDSTVTNGSRQPGIVIQGTAAEKATGCTIGVGVVRGHGAQSSSLSGGIDLTQTLGAKVDGAVLIECSPASIILRGKNTAVSLAYTSVDPWTTDLFAAPHLRLNDADNTGHLGDHVFERASKVAAYVGSEGIRVDNLAGNALTLSPGYETTLARAGGVATTMTRYVDPTNAIRTPVGHRLTVGGEAAATATPLRNLLVASSAWDPASLAVGAVVSLDFTVTGARVGDPVIASHDMIGVNSVVISGHVRQSNVVRVVIRNETGATFDIPAGTVRVAVLNFTA